mmetsp:Transcript_207/g.546  ORF Transcript_207/g.546 Transcript_207/m.546 type:complete len:227 (-) Transcript_207:369-1049(-)
MRRVYHMQDAVGHMLGDLCLKLQRVKHIRVDPHHQCSVRQRGENVKIAQLSSTANVVRVEGVAEAHIAARVEALYKLLALMLQVALHLEERQRLLALGAHHASGGRPLLRATRCAASTSLLLQAAVEALRHARWRPIAQHCHHTRRGEPLVWRVLALSCVLPALPFGVAVYRLPMGLLHPDLPVGVSAAASDHDQLAHLIRVAARPLECEHSAHRSTNDRLAPLDA